jgi:acetylglutamate kinase
MATNVLKIGGNQLDDPAFIAGTAQAIRTLIERGGDPHVIVHGGGKGIKALQEKLGLQPQYVEGLRVTDPATLEIVMMVLCGQANLTLVAALVGAGVQAQGYNGADRWLLRGRKFAHPTADLGRVGEVAAVNVPVLREALAAGVVPVIAPVLLGEDGGFFNANADRAAGAVAAALGAARVTFLTDVAGVLIGGQAIAHLTRAGVERLIADGVITGGMAVKVNAALDALGAGVGQAVITNLDGLMSGAGTVVSS